MEPGPAGHPVRCWHPLPPLASDRTAQLTELEAP
jgi:hypothetical protein